MIYHVESLPNTAVASHGVFELDNPSHDEFGTATDRMEFHKPSLLYKLPPNLLRSDVYYKYLHELDATTDLIWPSELKCCLIRATGMSATVQSLWVLWSKFSGG